MNTADNSHCRLCAQLKPLNKLYNLQLDEKKRQEISAKLTRINASTDLQVENLPKTVCLVCIDSLDRAFEFVMNVAQSQAVLTNVTMLREIKKETQETNYSDDDHVPYDFPEDIKDENVKIELPDVKPETLAVVKMKKQKKINKCGSSRKSLGLDTIPLSLLKLTWKDYNWTCSYCGTQFSTIEELTKHSMQYHDSCNAYRCTDCNIRKLRLDSFIVHVKRHRKYLKLSCYKCHARFPTVHEANVHKNTHRNTDHICPGCNTIFMDTEELKQHSDLYYQARRSRGIPLIARLTEDLTCILCKKTFKHKGSLATHLLIHTERKRDHTCDKCGKCFLNKQNLAGHMILHDNIRPYQCEICKASFKTPGQLRNHVGVHDNKKPFACDQCGRCFRLQKQLTSHSIIHTDSLPHVCSFCNKGFRFRTILNQHVRQHTGIKPYSCKLCQRDFTNWPNYNKHMKRRHGMDMAKKKHTPDGVYPINPATGEVVIYPETNKMIEWKRQMMRQRRPGRPKGNLKMENEESNYEVNVEIDAAEPSLESVEEHD